MSAVPQIKSDDELYSLLREGRIDEFNERTAAGEVSDLTYCDFRGLDLRGWNPSGLDLTGGYFRSADLRGVDFSDTQLDGGSLIEARISGTLFPSCLSPQEIMMSLEHGTRLRTV